MTRLFLGVVCAAALTVACSDRTETQQAPAAAVQRAALVTDLQQLSPFDNARGNFNGQTLSATATHPMGGSLFYTFEWADNARFTNPTLFSVPAAASGQIVNSPALAPIDGRTYYWKVRVSDDGGTSWVSSPVRSFTMDSVAVSVSWFQTARGQFQTNQFQTARSQYDDGLLTGGVVKVGFVPGPLADPFTNLNRWYRSASSMPAEISADPIIPDPTAMKMNDQDTNGEHWYVSDGDPGVAGPEPIPGVPAQGRTRVSVWASHDGVRFLGGGLVSNNLFICFQAGTNAGSYSYVNGAGTWSVMQPRDSQWHELSFIYNNDSKTFDVYLDDEQYGAGEAYFCGGGASRIFGLLGIGNNFAPNGATDLTITGLSYFDNAYVENVAGNGTVRSTPIRFADRPAGTNRWGQLSWSVNVASGVGSVLTQVEYFDGSSWQLIPDANLPNNSAGFSTGAVPLGNLEPSKYPEIRLVATLNRALGFGPSLLDWQVSWVEDLARPSKLVVTTPPRTFLAGQCGGAAQEIVVRAQNSQGVDRPAGTNGIPFTASSTSTGTVTWYADPSCTTVVSGGNFLIPSGSAFMTLYYVDTKAGLPSISIASVLENPPPQTHQVTAGPATVMVKEDGDLQLGTVGQTLLYAFVVRVEDAYANPVVGINVDFSTSSGGSVSPSSVVTGVNGTASALGTLGPVAGSNTFTASLPSDPGLTQTFSATAVSAPAATIVKVSGDGQVDTVGTQLTDPLIVQAQDAYGNPVSGVIVNFQALTGNGTVTVGSPVSGSDGQVSATATLGTVAGPHGFSASAGSLGTVVFDAMAVAGAPVSLAKIGGDAQTGVVGTTLGSALMVRVEDAYGNPVSNVSVSFQVASGNGTLAPGSTVSDGNGLASAVVTLGTAAGLNVFSASVVGLPVMSFTAIGTADAPSALIMVSGDGQTGTVGQALASPFVVRVEDSYGNPIESFNVTFAVSSGDGSLTESSVSTDVNGEASSLATLATVAGANSFEVTASVLTPLTFSATGLAGAATHLVFTTAPHTFVAGQCAGPASPIFVALTDAFGNPAVAGPGSHTFNAASDSSGTVSWFSDESCSVASPSGEFTIPSGGSFVAMYYVDSRAGSPAVSLASSLVAPAPQVHTVVAGSAASLVKVSGDLQSAEVGSALVSALVARVEDAWGNPVANTTVSFAVELGNGSVSPSGMLSGANGEVSASATLGPSAGLNNFSFSSGALPVLTFSATGVAGAASALVKVDGDLQTAAVGATLQPFIVRVEDSYGNPVSGVTVSFGLVDGGSITPASTLSASNGEASATATLGTAAGSYGFTASSGMLPGVSFGATAVAGAPAALIKVSGDLQSATVGTALAEPFVVRVEDSYGNPLSGVSVSFAASAGSGSINPLGVLSSVNGEAGAYATLGTLAGINSYTVSSGALPALTFSATGLAGPAAALVKVSGDLQSGMAGAVLPMSLVARLMDSYGNPVSGVSVDFVAATGGGGISPASMLSAANGEVSATATLGPSAGSNTFTASSGPLPAITFSATSAAGTAATLQKVSGDLQSGVVGSVLGSALVVRLADAYGNAVAGVSVSFSASSGSVSPVSVLTDANGQASTVATLGTTAGPQTFTVSSGALPALSFSATAFAGAAASLVKVSGDLQSATAGAALVSPLVVRVIDAFANPVAGASVSFSVASGGGTLSPSIAASGANGEASATATLGPLAGANSFTASFAALPSVTFSATGLAGAPAELVILTGDGQSGTVGTALASSFVVQARDANQNPVAGLTVVFAVGPAGGSVAPGSVTTDSSGMASALGTLGTAAGAYTFTASASGVATVTFNATGLAGAVATLVKVSGDLQSGVVGAALSAPLVARLEDAYGNPVAGGSVAFSVASGGGSIAPSSMQSAANGQVSATATLGATAGANSFTVSFGALPPLAFSATAVAGAAASLVKVSGDLQSGTAGSALAAPLVVRVEDASGNPVPGVSVAFVPVSGGGSISPASVTSDGSGLASATATLGALVGGNSFSASVGASSVTFAAEGLAGAAASLFKVSGDTQTGTVNTFLAAPFVVRVLDVNGNPVAGRTVSFAVVGGGGSISTAPILSDANGEASATGKLGTVPVTNTYSATSVGLAGSPLSFTATANAGAAASLVKVNGDNQTGVVGNLLGLPFVVRVVDEFGNPVSGAAVSFSVVSGGGSVSSATVVSAANGQASTTGTLGTLAGANTYEASVTGLGGATQTFTATGLAGAASVLRKVSGDPQTATVGAALSSPFVVRVEDQYENPVSGITVFFSVLSGGGSLSATSALSAANGLASVTATLGTTAGLNTFGASRVGLIGNHTFSATGTPAAPASLSLLSGGGQTATVGTTLAQPFVVQLQDVYGNAVPGLTVNFGVSSGAGSVSVPGAASDAAGSVSFTGTLGSIAGLNSYTASHGLLTPLVINATGVAGDATRLVYSTPARTFVAGQCAGAGSVITVSLQDAFGNSAVAGLAGESFTLLTDSTGTVGWYSEASCSAVAAGGAFTIAAGQSSVDAYYMDTRAGQPAIAVSSALTVPAAQVHTVVPGAAAALVYVSGDAQTGTIESALASPLVVLVRDAYANAVEGMTVSFEVVTGGGSVSPSAVVSAVDGQASATATLGSQLGPQSFLASVTGLSGSPIPFVATAQPKPATQLAITSAPQTLVAGDCSGALVIEAQDAAGQPTQVLSALAVNLTSTSLGTTFFLDACITAATSATIAANTGSITVYFRDTVAGTPTLTAAATGLGLASQQQVVTPAAPAKIVITSASQVLGVGVCSAPVSFQLEDVFGNVSPAAAATTISLTSTSSGNTFFSDACNTATGALVLAAGASSGTFHFKDTQLGTPVLTLSASGLTAASQQQTLTVGPLSKLVLVIDPSSITAGVSTANLSAEAFDAFDNSLTTYQGPMKLSVRDGAPGTILPAETVSATAGKATWTFGSTAAGTRTLEASVGDVRASVIVNVLAGPADHLNATAAVEKAPLGETVAIAFQVVDAYGNGVAGERPFSVSASHPSCEVTVPESTGAEGAADGELSCSEAVSVDVCATAEGLVGEPGCDEVAFEVAEVIAVSLEVAPGREGKVPGARASLRARVRNTTALPVSNARLVLSADGFALGEVTGPRGALETDELGLELSSIDGGQELELEIEGWISARGGEHASLTASVVDASKAALSNEAQGGLDVEMLVADVGCSASAGSPAWALAMLAGLLLLRFRRAQQR